MARTAVTDPLAFLHAVTTTHKLVYLLLVFGPFLGLWLLEPLLLLGVVPDLAINLLSSDPNQTSVVFHNASGMLPLIVAGSILGLARLRRLAPGLAPHVPRIALYVLAAVAVTAPYSPFDIGVGWAAEALPSNPIHQARATALSLIPAGAPVSASDQLGAHLSQRLRIMVFPYAIDEARWIIVDRSDPSYADKAWYERRIGAMLHDRRWRVMYSSRGILVFHKLPAPR
jgi:hypothetical protein